MKWELCTDALGKHIMMLYTINSILHILLLFNTVLPLGAVFFS